MARSAVKVVVLLTVALLAVPHAEAGKKGLITKGLVYGKGKGKGGDVNVNVQCQDVCNDVCVPVPRQVCTDVPFQTQECHQVPVQVMKQHCDRVCTQTYTQPMSTGKGKGVAVNMGHGKGKSMAVNVGHGRHLLHKKKMMIRGGKGAGALVSSNCQDVCKDVPYTKYTTECQEVTLTRTQCETVHEQSCRKVCKPHCQRITTVTTTQTISSGKGAPVVMGKGH